MLCIYKPINLRLVFCAYASREYKSKLTLVLQRFDGDCAQDEAIRDHNDDKRNDEDGQEVEDVVCLLVSCSREKFERNTLLKPPKNWMCLRVKYNTLSYLYTTHVMSKHVNVQTYY